MVEEKKKENRENQPGVVGQATVQGRSPGRWGYVVELLCVGGYLTSHGSPLKKPHKKRIPKNFSKKHKKGCINIHKGKEKTAEIRIVMQNGV